MQPAVRRALVFNPYLPPEQAAGRIGEVDERSDVFSLGGILYRMLTHEALPV